MDYLQVPNWHDLQHYKDRAPVWIKSYGQILDDYRFAALPDAAKGHVFAIQLLARRNSNKLPRDARWIGQRISAHEPVDLDALVTAGFLESYDPASTSLASRKQPARESRGDQKREEPRAREPPGSSSPPAARRGGDPELVGDLVPPTLEQKRNGYLQAARSGAPMKAGPS